jgi:hypothetical protein
MRVASKEQFMALVEPGTLRRLDALRIVMGRSRARVAEQALLSGGLDMLEFSNQERLQRLRDVAARAGMYWEDYVQLYAEINARVTYGPSLEALEEKPKLKRVAKKAVPRVRSAAPKQEAVEALATLAEQNAGA